MVALVAVETLLLVLLTLLVAGLLRSHAEILRRLGPPPDAGGEGQPGSSAGALPEPRRRSGGGQGRDVVGATLAGDALMIGLGDGSPPTLLAFLSSGCAVCERLWAQLRDGRPQGLPEHVRLVAVAKDANAESPSRLRALAPAMVPLVLSSAAWRDYSVPATPYFVYLEGGRVQGEGSAGGWEQILSLLRDADADVQHDGGRADAVADVLAAAGIGPDHPSLYPAGRPGPQ
ncbi:MAG: thioredoxin domain-containing protein [Solirubrobacteraceae bacterium]